MTDLPSAHFDFALYSYNGLDYVDHAGRLSALAEIRRVLKAGAPFLFSTHNATAVDRIFALRLSLDPRKTVEAVKRYVALRRINRDWRKLRDQDIVWFNDGAHDFGLLTYYIRPRRQIEQLGDFGFEDVRVFALSGRELSSEELTDPSDKWLYYLAKRGC